MFDIGFSELLVIGLVALIVVGPRDLPGMFRTLGRFTAKARAMAREFQTALESAADETGVNKVADDLKKVTSPGNLGLDDLNRAVDGLDDLGENEPFGEEHMKTAWGEKEADSAEKAPEGADAKTAKKDGSGAAKTAGAAKPAEKKSATKKSTTKKTAAKTTAAKKQATGSAAAKKPAADRAGGKRATARGASGG